MSRIELTATAAVIDYIILLMLSDSRTLYRLPTLSSYRFFDFIIERFIRNLTCLIVVIKTYPLIDCLRLEPKKIVKLCLTENSFSCLLIIVGIIDNLLKKIKFTEFFKGIPDINRTAPRLELIKANCKLCGCYSSLVLTLAKL